MACYLVTGCAGFVGWRTAEILLEAGHTVVGGDDLNAYYDVRIKKWRLRQLQGRGGFTFLPGNVADRGHVQQLFAAAKDCAGVLHLGARAGVRASLEEPRLYFEANTLGALEMLLAVQERGIPKFVLASTSSIYAGHPMPFREDAPVNNPISPYAASKKAAEALAYTYHHLYGIDVSVVRYFTVYGPAGRPDMAPLKFLHRIATGQPLPLFGDGLQSRDFTYIDDIARGTIAALNGEGYGIYNLGCGRQPVTILEMIQAFEATLGRKAIIDYQPENPTDMRHTRADITRARERLGWEPQVAPAEGFRRTAEWYLQEQAWLKDLSI